MSFYLLPIEFSSSIDFMYGAILFGPLNRFRISASVGVTSWKENSSFEVAKATVSFIT